MFDSLFVYLDFVDDFLWEYVGMPAIVLFGVYLMVKSKFLQVRGFPAVVRRFIALSRVSSTGQGVHPLRAFFASVGGCVGMGNVVVVCIAVQLGGPGAIFWLWITALVSMLLKYAEVYLGIKYRVSNESGEGYNGGSIYYLRRAFKGLWVPVMASFFLCIYGVEILQFNLITASVTSNFHLNQYLVVAVLLGLVLYAGSGGVDRVGKICSALIPTFVVVYLIMGGWVLLQNVGAIPAALKLIVTSAFTGHAAVGGFAGSGVLLAMIQGVKRASYTGDVGIGYASVIHSESSVERPQHQASLTIIELFLDTFIICTMSLILIVVTGVWKEPIHSSMLVQTALAAYFPYMNFFMPFFLFLLGYSTLISYFCFGLKSSEYLSPHRGRKIYTVYAAMMFMLFSFVETTQALAVMAITGALLLAINIFGMFRLRKEIHFDL